MFSDDFSYNHRPSDWACCCARMYYAVMKTMSIEILGNYKHVIDWKQGCGCDVLDFCPWCRADCRSQVVEGSKNNGGG